MRWIDYGLGGLESSTVSASDPTIDDLALLYSDLATQGKLFGFEATERFYEIGTPAALEETERFLRQAAKGS
jgi:NDP-sugar pyrophosphorylase family protein